MPLKHLMYSTYTNSFIQKRTEIKAIFSYKIQNLSIWNDSTKYF